MNTVMPGAYSVPENSCRENIAPMSVGRPWRETREILFCTYSSENYKRYCKKTDVTDKIYLMAATVET